VTLTIPPPPVAGTALLPGLICTGVLACRQLATKVLVLLRDSVLLALPVPVAEPLKLVAGFDQ